MGEVSRRRVPRPGPCPRCGTPLPFLRKPTSFRQAFAGGWTCRECGTGLDRVGRPLDEYPPPGPSRYWTQTLRGAVGLLLAGVFYVLCAAFLVWASVAFPESARWWKWLVVAGLVILAIPTIVTSGMSVHAHRRRPLPERARDRPTGSP